MDYKKEAKPLNRTWVMTLEFADGRKERYQCPIESMLSQAKDYLNFHSALVKVRIEENKGPEWRKFFE